MDMKLNNLYTVKKKKTLNIKKKNTHLKINMLNFYSTLYVSCFFIYLFIYFAQNFLVNIKASGISKHLYLKIL